MAGETSHYGELYTTDGLRVLVDLVDFPRVAALTWRSFSPPGNRRIYAVRTEGRRTVYMHRFILGAPSGTIVDHRNLNGLDNRRSNLRYSTNAENGWNAAKTGVATTSKRKGVSWHAIGRKWQAHICANGKRYYLGLFSSEEEAAKAYADAAQRLHGKFARAE